MKENVIAYLRVSTNEQEDKYGFDAQLEMIKKYCEEHEYNLVQIFQEQHCSVEDGREVLENQIINADNVSNPPYNKLIVAYSDRVARDMQLYFYYKFLLGKKGIDLISVNEDFGGMGDFAPLIESFVVFAAGMERNKITKRTTGGRNNKARTGGYAGGRCPYGYCVRNKELVIDEDEADIVRTIFFAYENGQSKLGIAKSLNESGFTTRKGGSWYASNINSIISNKALYQGFYQYGENEVVKGQHEPILMEDAYADRG